jgi:Zn-dependent M32 family carboxypeptidase
VERQRDFAREIVVAMGIDLGRARLDLSTHPSARASIPATFA